MRNAMYTLAKGNEVAAWEGTRNPQRRHKSPIMRKWGSRFVWGWFAACLFTDATHIQTLDAIANNDISAMQPRIRVGVPPIESTARNGSMPCNRCSAQRPYTP